MCRGKCSRAPLPAAQLGLPRSPGQAAPGRPLNPRHTALPLPLLLPAKPRRAATLDSACIAAPTVHRRRHPLRPSPPGVLQHPRPLLRPEQPWQPPSLPWRRLPLPLRRPLLPRRRRLWPCPPPGNSVPRGSSSRRPSHQGRLCGGAHADAAPTSRGRRTRVPVSEGGPRGSCRCCHRSPTAACRASEQPNADVSAMRHIEAAATESVSAHVAASPPRWDIRHVGGRCRQNGGGGQNGDRGGRNNCFGGSTCRRNRGDKRGQRSGNSRHGRRCCRRGRCRCKAGRVCERWPRQGHGWRRHHHDGGRRPSGERHTLGRHISPLHLQPPPDPAPAWRPPRPMPPSFPGVTPRPPPLRPARHTLQPPLLSPRAPDRRDVGCC